jgi:hypothetical protein
MIHLLSSEGTVIEASFECLRSCKFINDILSSSECEDILQERQIIPLDNFSTRTLRLLVEFLEYHLTDPLKKIPKVKFIYSLVIFISDSLKTNYSRSSMQPLPVTLKLKTILQPWYYSFIITHKEELVDLLKASDFLVCSPLYELICATIASIIRDQPMEKKSAFFGLN